MGHPWCCGVARKGLPTRDAPQCPSSGPRNPFPEKGGVELGAQATLICADRFGAGAVPGTSSRLSEPTIAGLWRQVDATTMGQNNGDLEGSNTTAAWTLAEGGVGKERGEEEEERRGDGLVSHKSTAAIWETQTRPSGDRSSQ